MRKNPHIDQLEYDRTAARARLREAQMALDTAWSRVRMSSAAPGPPVSLERAVEQAAADLEEVDAALRDAREDLRHGLLEDERDWDLADGVR